jgi:hypothetical protein
VTLISHRFDVPSGHGIDVAAEDRAAWDAAVAEFKKTLGDASIRRALPLIGGVQVEAAVVLGAAEYGLDGSRANLTQQ